MLLGMERPLSESQIRITKPKARHTAAISEYRDANTNEAKCVSILY